MKVIYFKCVLRLTGVYIVVYIVHMKDKKCLRCGKEWTSRLDNPKSCIGCGSYKWQIPRDTSRYVGDRYYYLPEKYRGEITQSLVRNVFNYDPLSGILTWNDYPNRDKGEVAGYPIDTGYLRVAFCSTAMTVQYVAWMYIYGYFPEEIIDHRDRVRDNNAIDNLQETSQHCNSRNHTINKNNKSGVPGVRKIKDGCWYVSISRFYLGLFTTKVEAVAHRLAAEQCLDWPNSFTYGYAITFMKENI